jgi:FkbM family methyltransferase
VPHYAELLRKDRPDETVLQVALADSEGTLELNVISETGLSTCVDAYAQQHKLTRGGGQQRIQVPVLTLKSALRSIAGKDVHWLKIDVEGLEEEVLRGWDSQILRPWVMVVESTIPNSPETSYASWDPILTAANYQFVYFDGLNRFYIANEHADLAEAFSCPPNVFDGVELSGLATWELCRGLIAAHQTTEEVLHTQNAKLVAELNSAGEVHAQLQARVEWLQNEWGAAKQRVEELSKCIGRLEGDLESESQRTAQLGVDLQAAREHEIQLQAKVEELNHSSDHWWTVANRLSHELEGAYASRSWRLTAPLRWLNFQSHRLLLATAAAYQGAAHKVRRHATSAIAYPVAGGRNWLRRRPRLDTRIKSLIRRSPMLYRTLRRFAVRVDSRSYIVQSESPTNHDALLRTHLAKEGLLSIDELMRRVLKEAGKAKL